MLVYQRVNLDFCWFHPHFWWFLAFQGLASFGARWPRPWDLAHRHGVQGPATTCLEDPGALAVRRAIFLLGFLGVFFVFGRGVNHGFSWFLHGLVFFLMFWWILIGFFLDFVDICVFFG